MENVIDRVETCSIVLLGLTMGCARCHDHKYDPISQREFYRFLAFFNSTKDAGFYSETRGNTGPTVRVIQPDQQRRIDEFEAAIAKADEAVAAAHSEDDSQFSKWLKTIRDNMPAKSLPVPSVGLSLHGDLQIAISKQKAGDDKGALGMYQGGEPHWGEGLTGRVLELSGESKSHVDLGERVRVTRDEAFSIACWVRPRRRRCLMEQDGRSCELSRF